jgi:hypothetical protein
MVIYIIFATCLWASDESTSGQDNHYGNEDWHKLILCILMIIFIVLLRPIVLEFFYFIFYEPLGRVEEGNIETLRYLRRMVAT